MTGSIVYIYAKGVHTLKEKKYGKKSAVSAQRHKGVLDMKKEKEVEAYLKGELPEEKKLKYELAQELGVLDKVLESGWKSLSAKETGRIGGLLASKRKEER